MIIVPVAGDSMMRSTLSLFILATVIVCACLSVHSRAAPLPLQHVYVIEYRPGSAWQPGVPMNKQALGPHASYWKQLASEARAVGAGPYRDIDGGMAILTATTLDEARAIVASDPAVSSNIFVAELHEWSPLIRGAGDLPRATHDGPVARSKR